MAFAPSPTLADRLLPRPFAPRWGAVAEKLSRRSRTVAAFFDARMEGLILGWLSFMGLACLAKVLTGPVPVRGWEDAARQVLSYALVALSPVAGFWIAAGSFPRGLVSAQPILRLARIGRWRSVDPVSACRNPAFGPAGFMASLLAGMILNVPVRTAEYLVAIPSVGAGAPGWAQTLHLAMTADVVVMNFFYMACFVMALRSVPMFPRMLAFTWAVDVGMQFMIAGMVTSEPDLPATVGMCLKSLLHGNLQKAFISVAVWLPYLLLSDRVNITYRRRIRVRL